MGTYLITGANRGIGLGLARALQARGDRVIGTARDPDAALALRDTGARVELLDVTDAASLAGLVERLRGVPIDVLINNAGRQHPDMELNDVDPEVMVEVYRLNSIAPLMVTAALRPNLRAGVRKTVVNVSSDLGSLALNAEPGDLGWYSYRASKAALNTLTVNLARELGDEGFCCIALHPGWVRTDMGGPRAPLGIEDSVGDILELLDGLTPADNGRYLRHNGETMPW